MAPIMLLLLLSGTFLGSFFLVIIDRIPRSVSPFKGRSKCENCHHTLSALDLIPIVSYLALRGKCRYCKAPLSYIYPTVEIITGILYAVTPLLVTLNTPAASGYFFPLLLFSLYVISTFIIIFFMDLKYGLIPFMVILPSVLITILYTVIFTPDKIISALVSAVLAGVFFYFIHAITRGRGMGFGDVVLVLYLGLLLGFPGIVTALYIAFLTGAVVSLILIVTKRKTLKNSTIPFGPFLVFGAYISYFWGERLYTFFYNLLLIM